MTTAYSTEYTALAFLAFCGVDVREGDVPQVQCEWCGDVDHVTTVRVHARPMLETFAPVEDVDVCAFCAGGVIRQALRERDGDADLVIELNR
ncbi:MAG: hypothetical protein M3443_11585 [Actinomycetota bacterium]|nr:hypothetical protein [Actinomycetota bacterium]